MSAGAGMAGIALRVGFVIKVNVAPTARVVAARALSWPMTTGRGVAGEAVGQAGV